MRTCFLVISFLYLSVYLLIKTKYITVENQNSFTKEFTLPLRGLCALFVVTGHIENYLNSAALGSFGLLHIFHWSTPAVSIFFFLSGYGLYKKTQRKPINDFKWILPAIVKIFVSLVVICCVYLCVYYILDKQECVRFLSDCISDRKIELLPHSWYMYVLILFYVLFYLNYKYLNGFKAFGGVCVSLILYSVFVWFDKFFNLEFLLWTKAIWSFPLGIFISIKEEQIKDFIKKHTSLIFIGCPIVIILFILPSFYIHDCPADRQFLNLVILNLLGVLVYFLFLYMKFPNNIIGKILTYMGTISMEIYLVQGIFQMGLLYFIENKFLYVLMNYVSIILFAIIMHRFFKKIGLYGSK